MSLEQPPPPGHRASDKDRDRAAGLVQEAHSDGRLDVEELDERLTRVYSAKTAVELEAATADLLPAVRGGKSEVTIRATGSSQRREGSWEVAERISAVAAHSSITLDFTDAVVRWPELHVETQAVHSSVVLIVPAGWSIDLDDVELHYSSSDNKAGPADGVRLHLTGTATHSSVVVRHPRKRRWWWPWYRK
jgi:hypothetical protein